MKQSTFLPSSLFAFLLCVGAHSLECRAFAQQPMNSGLNTGLSSRQKLTHPQTVGSSSSQSAPTPPSSGIIVKLRDSSSTANQNAQQASLISIDDVLADLSNFVHIKNMRALRSGNTAAGAATVGPAAAQVNLSTGVERMYVLNFKKEDESSEAIRLLNKDPRVEYAEPNFIVSTSAAPNDPFFPEQWPLHNTGQKYLSEHGDAFGSVDIDLDAPEAWELQTDCSSVPIAIVDTGLDYLNPDLAANTWINSAEIPNNGVDDDRNGFIDDYHGYNFIDYARNSDPLDDHGHGTHVAGIVGAVGNNNIGITGVCWQTRMMALKFLGAYGSGLTSDAIEAWDYAIKMGAKIVVNSWGGSGYSQALQDMADKAFDAGVLLVAAAGNSRTELPFYPAAYRRVLSVAATDASGALAFFSNYGSWVDISAPGDDILSLRAGVTRLGRTHPTTHLLTVLSGTSMAAPHVAGVAALVLAHAQENGGEMSVTDLYLRLKYSGDILNNLPSDIPYGDKLTAGRLNALSALTKELDIPTDFSAYAFDYSPSPRPGSSSILTFTVVNRGSPSTNTRVRLTTTNPKIQIPTSELEVGTLELEAEERMSFQINLSQDTLPGEEIKFLLEISSANGAVFQKKFATIVANRDLSWLRVIEEPTSREHTPIVVDLNGDGTKEVVLYTNASGPDYFASLYALKANGDDFPGWPIRLEPDAREVHITSIAAGDLNGDGEYEVATVYYASTDSCVKLPGDGPSVCYRNKLAAFDNKGRLLSGFPVFLAPTLFIPTIHLATTDYNADGKDDIILLETRTRRVPESEQFSRLVLDSYLTVYNVNGQLIGPTPEAQIAEWDKSRFDNLALADLDQDGIVEVLFGAAWSPSRHGGLFPTTETGNLLPGKWPAFSTTSFLNGAFVSNRDVAGGRILAVSYHDTAAIVDFFGNPIKTLGVSNFATYGEHAISDLNRDDSSEFILGDAQGVVSVYDRDGKPLPGWPVYAPNFEKVDSLIESQFAAPVAANIDSDPFAEVVIWTYKDSYTSGDNEIHRLALLNAWNHDGTPALGFPRAYHANDVGENVGSAAIADLDGNGKVEIISVRGQYNSRMSKKWEKYSGKTYVSSIELDAPPLENAGDWPMGRGNVKQTRASSVVSSSAYRFSGTWNGFLDQQNIIECINTGGKDLRANLFVKDLNGNVIQNRRFFLPQYASVHLPLGDSNANQARVRNTYGTFEVRTTDQLNGPNLRCHNMLYRFPANDFIDPVEYAYSLPVRPSISGPSSGIFNSMNPQPGDTRPVYNWLSVYNSGSTVFEGTIEVYKQDGTRDDSRRIILSNLYPGNRRDFALGHDRGQETGLYRILPASNSSTYDAFIMRFGAQAEGFAFALPLFAQKENCAMSPISVSTMGSALNWLEIANPSPNPVIAQYQVRDRFGTVLRNEAQQLAPFSQHHVFINEIIGSNNVGSAEVLCDSNNNVTGLLVQSMYYGFEPGSNLLSWAYGVQKASDDAASQKRAGFFNTFLGAHNWSKVFNATGVSGTIQTRAYDNLGAPLNERSNYISSFGSLDQPVHELVGYNSLGWQLIQAENTRAKIQGEVLRVYPDARSGIGYITPVASQPLP